MSRCRMIHAVPCLIVIASLAGTRASWADVALGASFGYTHLSYPDISQFKNDVFGIPGAGEWGQPGFRVGYHSPGGRWDLNADLGFVHVGRSGTLGADETNVELLPQVQVNASWHGFNPFVNGGVGVMHETALTAYGASITGTRPVYGAGVGGRKAVSDGHGFVRVELRYDHLPKHVVEPLSSVNFTFPATDLFSVKLGFDLLVAR